MQNKIFVYCSPESSAKSAIQYVVQLQITRAVQISLVDISFLSPILYIYLHWFQMDN